MDSLRNFLGPRKSNSRNLIYRNNRVCVEVYAYGQSMQHMQL